MTEQDLRDAIGRILSGDELRECVDAATGDVARQGNPDALDLVTDWDHAAKSLADLLAHELAVPE